MATAMNQTSSTPSRYLRNRFAHALKGDVEFGGLRVLRWRISQEEARQYIHNPELLKVAKQIEARWTLIELEYGEGSLLAEENEIAQLLAAPGGRFDREPHLLENARRFRVFKGPEWWTAEHQLDLLAEVVGCHTLQPCSDQILSKSQTSSDLRETSHRF